MTKRILFVSVPGDQRVAHKKAAEIIMVGRLAKEVSTAGTYETLLYHDIHSVRSLGHNNLNPTLDSLESVIKSEKIDLLVLHGKIAYDIGLAEKGYTPKKNLDVPILLAPVYTPCAPRPQPRDNTMQAYLDTTRADFAVSNPVAMLPVKLAEAIRDILQGKVSCSYMSNTNKYAARLVMVTEDKPTA